MGLLLFPRRMPYEGECSSQDDICSAGELSTGILVVILSALSPELQNPDSPHATLFFSVLPLPESRMSSYEQDFVHWSFKRVPVSRGDSYLFLENKIPAGFHSQILCGHLFSALVLWAWKTGLGLRPPASQGDLLQLRCPSRISAAAYGSWSSPLCNPQPSYQS